MSKLTDLIDSNGKPKIAPVQGYPGGIPWSIHLEAYEMYCRRYGTQDALIDLEGKGCRGGFGVGELDMFIPGWRDRVTELGKLRKEVADLRAQLAQRPASVVDNGRDVGAWGEGVLMAVATLVACHDQPTMATTILNELGLRNADCSGLNDFDKTALRKLKAERHLELRGLEVAALAAQDEAGSTP